MNKCNPSNQQVKKEKKKKHAYTQKTLLLPLKLFNCYECNKTLLTFICELRNKALKKKKLLFYERFNNNSNYNLSTSYILPKFDAVLSSIALVSIC